MGDEGVRVGGSERGSEPSEKTSAFVGVDERASACLSLRLYIAGESPNSVRARSNLQAVLEASPQTEVTLEVVDVLIHPERGLADGVLVTPTLIRLGPAPERRVIGNLCDRDALLAGLGMDGVKRE